MSYNVTLFGLKFTLSPVAFTIPLGSKHWDIYWYGIIIAAGFLLALIYGLKKAGRYGLNPDKMLDVILVATPVAILSARAYYVIFDGEKLDGIKDFFGFGNSSGFAGLAIYGGVIGAFVSGGIMCYIRKVNILNMFDVASAGFLIGQGIGRWGNFINREAFGAQTDIFCRMGLTVPGFETLYVHPTFLYESLWNFVGLIALHIWSKKGKRKYDGQIFWLYILWYGLGRAWIEGLRTDSLYIGTTDIRVSQLLAAVSAIAALVVLIINAKKQHRPEDLFVNLKKGEDNG